MEELLYESEGVQEEIYNCCAKHFKEKSNERKWFTEMNKMHMERLTGAEKGFEG